MYTHIKTPSCTVKIHIILIVNYTSTKLNFKKDMREKRFSLANQQPSTLLTFPLRLIMSNSQKDRESL